jgi:hypothetical protein
MAWNFLKFRQPGESMISTRINYRDISCRKRDRLFFSSLRCPLPLMSSPISRYTFNKVVTASYLRILLNQPVWLRESLQWLTHWIGMRSADSATPLNACILVRRPRKLATGPWWSHDERNALQMELLPRLPRVHWVSGTFPGDKISYSCVSTLFASSDQSKKPWQGARGCRGTTCEQSLLMKMPIS